MADEQLKKRVNEILKISTNLISAVGDLREDFGDLREDVKKIKSVQNEHSKRFDNIENDVSTLKDGQKRIEGMVTDALYKIIELQKRVDKVEKHLKNNGKQFEHLENKVENIQKELSKLSNKVDKIAHNQKNIFELENRVERLEEEVFA